MLQANLLFSALRPLIFGTYHTFINFIIIIVIKINKVFELNFQCDSNADSEYTQKINEQKRNLTLRGIMGQEASFDSLSVSK